MLEDNSFPDNTIPYKFFVESRICRKAADDRFAHRMPIQAAKVGILFLTANYSCARGHSSRTLRHKGSPEANPNPS